MKFLRPYTFSWWQMGILKLALISIGILIGGYFREYLMEFKALFFIIAIVGSGYSFWTAMKQIHNK